MLQVSRVTLSHVRTDLAGPCQEIPLSGLRQEVLLSGPRQEILLS